MLIQKLFCRYMNQDGGEGGSAGGSAGGETNPASPVNNEGKQTNSGMSDKEAELVKEVMSKKKLISEQSAEIAQLKEQLKNFEGIDPEAVKKMIEESKAKEQAELERKGEFDRVKAQLIETHQHEVNNLKEMVKSVEDKLRSALGQNAELTVGNAFANSGFISRDTILTAPHARKLYGDHFAYENGQIVGYDKPAGSSERTVLIDGMGNPLSFDEALKKIIEADPGKDTILRSKSKPGAGSNTNKDTKADKQTKKMTTVEKIAVGLKKQWGSIK